MSNVGESQTVARISVKDRLGPLPNAGRERRSSFKRRGRSIDRNHRKFPKSAQGKPAETNFEKPVEGRISVHERLGVLPPQPFKKSDQFFHNRNRQQVWRHQGYHEAAAQQSQSKEPEPEPETETEPGLENVEKVKNFVNPPMASVPPRVQPFNAEQHRQTWTWVRPTTNSTAMDIDESIEESS